MIEIEWKMHNRIAYIMVSGTSDSVSIQNVDTELERVMNLATQAVHLIVDIHLMDQFPSLNNIIRSPYLRHMRRGWIVVIGLSEKPLFRILVNSFVNGLRSSARYADSLAEALALLQTLDSTLPGEA